MQDSHAVKLACDHTCALSGGGQVPSSAVQAAAGRLCTEDLPHAQRQREEGDHAAAGGMHSRP